MKKLRLSIVCVFTALGVVNAEARVTVAEPRNIGPCVVIAHRTGSLATNAIDTLVVNGGHTNWLMAPTVLAIGDTAATAYKHVLPYTIQLEGLASSAGGASTTDSLDVGIDISFDGRNWIQRLALGTVDATNASTTYDGFLISGPAAQPSAYMRFRLKNLGAGTGPMGVTISFLRKVGL